MPPLRTRFAPSPTGDLHLGGLFCAFVSYVVARQTGGAFVVRMEDIDGPRVVPGSAARIVEDLTALGLVADEIDAQGPYAPYVQSARVARYEDALRELGDAVYPCDCSRAEVARAASAPHAGEELVYPGICREKQRDRPMKRPPALRLRVPEGAHVTFDDAARGHVDERVDLAVGDFVLRRGDGVFAYQIACALDDHAMRIDLVVRGADLLGSTARQILLGRMLGEPRPPGYWHLPLVVTHEGERVAKRTRGTTVRELLERGVPKETLFGFLGHAAGLFDDPSPRTIAACIRDARSPSALLPRGDAVAVPPELEVGTSGEARPPG